MTESSAGKFELKSEPTVSQPPPPIPAGEGLRNTRPDRRKKDPARLVWDSKPKRPPSQRDIEFQTPEIVIPKYNLAVRVVDFFGNDAAGMVLVDTDAR